MMMLLHFFPRFFAKFLSMTAVVFHWALVFVTLIIRTHDAFDITKKLQGMMLQGKSLQRNHSLRVQETMFRSYV